MPFFAIIFFLLFLMHFSKAQQSKLANNTLLSLLETTLSTLYETYQQKIFNCSHCHPVHFPTAQGWFIEDNSSKVKLLTAQQMCDIFHNILWKLESACFMQHAAKIYNAGEQHSDFVFLVYNDIHTYLETLFLHVNKELLVCLVTKPLLFLALPQKAHEQKFESADRKSEFFQ